MNSSKKENTEKKDSFLLDRWKLVASLERNFQPMKEKYSKTGQLA